LNIVAKYQHDEVVICFWISSFCDLMYYGRMITGNFLLSGGLRQFYDVTETKIDLKCGFLDDETRGEHFHVRLIFLFKYEPETSDN
jgi:hypothetical protein